MISYGYVKELEKRFEEVYEVLPGELQKEGFGVLTKIPIHEKLHEKLGVDFTRYMIFGVCNPPNAYKALCIEENIGLMLPCNVVVYEKEGKTVLAVIKPTVAMQSVHNKRLAPVAEEVEEKLKRVFDAIN
jgi:uncharacterized protein (DUF302 family)